MKPSIDTIAGDGRALAVDRDPARRPGVPMIPPDPAPYPAVAGRPIERQRPYQRVLEGVEQRINVGGSMTPVFGTSVPPKGLSGLIRRAAYGIPEHKVSRWLLLLLGDRVDVWESRLRRHPVLALAGVGLVVGGVVLRRR